jgi:hypothetical protein
MFAPLFAAFALAVPQPVLKTTPLPSNRPVLVGAGKRIEVAQYDRLELDVDAPLTYANPFDPEEIDVYAQFHRHDGRVGGTMTVRVNGFLNQPFARKLVGNSETLTPSGKPQWQVRFAPPQMGAWTYKLYAKTRTGTMDIGNGQVNVTPAHTGGIVRRSMTAPTMFALDNGKPYFPVGENMGWAGNRGTFDFDDWLTSLSKAGGNWIRLWMTEGKCGIEWSGRRRTDLNALDTYAGYQGLGVYNLAEAARVDRILDTAERNGIKVMLCFGTYGEFKTGGYFNEGAWPRNPYNSANGGPCARPEDFWTNPTARKLYRQRLRYLLARYGSHANVFAWEFWNEAEAPVAWVGEMARYIKGTGEFAGTNPDPHHHLVSTTYGSADVWKLPEIDFTMTHNYGEGNMADHAPIINQDARQHTAYNKPHLMAEFGIDWRNPDSKYDPQGLGVNLHNGLWASIASGNAGTAMLWWWDNYVAPKSVYAPFIAARKFADAIPWTQGAWKPLTFDAAKTKDDPETFADLTLSAMSGWGKNAATELTLMPDGKVSGGVTPGFLYSPAKPDLRTVHTLHVHYTRPGRFSLRVTNVSDSAILRIRLDGKTAGEWNLTAHVPDGSPTRPEYVKTVYEPEYKVYLATYDKDYGIAVPAGDHAITLEVTGGDWLGVGHLTLSDYRSSRYPDVNLYGVTTGRTGVVWVQNGWHNWKNLYDNKPIPTVPPSEAVAHGLADGSYAVEWWDTQTGVILKTEQAVSANSSLPLHLPALPSDVAAHIKHL